MPLFVRILDRTVPLTSLKHFFDSESYQSRDHVEQHIIKLLANKTPGLDFSRLPTLFDGLPAALAKLELEFSALSQGIDVQYHQTVRIFRLHCAFND